ncbi:protein phosphatase 1 regulatory subunit 15B [Clupea harengus]|uniref:Protein phosphatase 1 regulatory subunit 15B n=1 Tax=Clupea harengus TaxID=7950 RepID=A0A6P3VQ48_CLUHA|nr:protein phosphatase 1 regulatory subunit 15B [Clupea harengus]
MLNMNSERHYSRGKTTSSLADGGVTAVRHESTERSWMDLLSFVSRPAWSLMQRYLPVNSLSAAQPHSQLWDTESFEQQLGFGHKLTQLEDTLSNRQPQLLHCEHSDNGFHPSVGVRGMTWLTADSLSEIGIQNIADNRMPQVTSGYLSSARNFLSQFFMLNVVSTQEVKRSQSSLLGCGAAIDGANSCVAVLSWSKETAVVAGTSISSPHSGSLCHVAEQTTMATVAKPTGLFVHCDDRSSKHSESAGHCCHKTASDNGSLHMLRPVSLSSEQLLRDQANTVSLLGDISVDCASREVVLLTPEQDNGYSSLEEELSISRLPSMRNAGEEQLVTDSEAGEEAQHSPIEQQPDQESGTPVPQPEEACAEAEQQECDHAGSEQVEVSEAQEQREVPELSTVSPCSNKAIAYIMGSPCSDDSSSGEDSDEDSDDDDGFNSEGSSCLSDSDSSEGSEEDDDNDDQSDVEEFDAETERLWNSLCQNRDPYNPSNFTASISTTPRTAQPPLETPSASLLSTSPLSTSPLSTSPLSTSPLSTSPLSTSPLSGLDGSSESGEEADEIESLRLWNSFSCSSDPYSPFNFQATLRTHSPPTRSSGKACSVPRYQKEQAEERQDSGFGDETPAPSTSSLPRRKLRKVRFCEEVEEFYTSGDEDRHGPWEEYARDRCRFQRRVLEVEESISFCLAPSYRRQVLHRLQLS